MHLIPKSLKGKNKFLFNKSVKSKEFGIIIYVCILTEFQESLDNMEEVRLYINLDASEDSSKTDNRRMGP
jgi:hypothetical protein